MFLIYFFQSIGAAIASVAAETIIAVVQIWIVRKELSPVKIAALGWHYYIAGIIMLAALTAMGNRLAPSVASTLLLAASGACIYFAILLMMRDEFFLSNIKKFIVGIKKKMQKTA